MKTSNGVMIIILFEVLYDFEIETDHRIIARSSHPVIVCVGLV